MKSFYFLFAVIVFFFGISLPVKAQHVDYIQKQVSFQEIDGNQNGFLDPGEQFLLILTITNGFSVGIANMKATIDTGLTSEQFDFVLRDAWIGFLASTEVKQVSFRGKVRISARPGTRRSVRFYLSGENYRSRFEYPFVISGYYP